MEEEKFDYAAAMKELEDIAQQVEKPETGIEDIDRYMERSKLLVEKCRGYLRDASIKIESL
ncbi:MAG: exodeoxyribonuclease VII small subunit [Bacteroidales bacterium]|nr:exodeoxyribonuclease VII small subunit [Bacteroidales bacterium]